MRKYSLLVLVVAALLTVTLTTGCVERKLTINTSPEGALVMLNDEEVGVSPVTVSFQWYGDYAVRISKPGFETLKTNRKLKAPLHDKFPFDFFAQLLTPRRIVDEYEWTFDLEQKKQIGREELIQNAQELKEQL